MNQKPYVSDENESKIENQITRGYVQETVSMLLSLFII